LSAKRYVLKSHETIILQVTSQLEAENHATEIQFLLGHLNHVTEMLFMIGLFKSRDRNAVNDGPI